MGGLSLGPLTLSAERAPVAAGLIALMIVTAVLARRSSPALSAWAGSAVVVAAITARLGFVLGHAGVYLQDPLSILAFWQSGFSPLWGMAGFVLVTAWSLWRNADLALPVAASTLIAFACWSVVHELSRGVDLALPEGLHLTSLNGDPVRPAEWRGRPMVINLWASWCPPCRREMPMMAEIAAQETEVDLHFVNQGEGAEAVRRYLAQSGAVIAPVMDPGGEMMRHFGAMGLPATLFIDANGQMQAAHMGEISRAQLLAGIEDLKDVLP
ncbi:TlpA disulfide reductase family protein [Paracoccus aminophilus]|uniref:Thiol:disulfide interchange protein DsbE n=1 Tax=Paracoccus aminophilus JCM 7686 TaxID=1367847 RepID=S5Y115_PARAH|nr:TlpA disulfide reductase family protein [Paracoccus aminophilus]AGT11187.1 thiol:disulfide interchange protein DsbE [Paracoccus aminophilus JCM 7686]